NKVDTPLPGIRHLIQRLYATVKSDDKRETVVCRVINPLLGNSVSFRISIGKIKLQARMELTEKTEHDRNGSCSIHIVVTVNKYPFLSADSLFNAGDRFIHITHKERIV